MEIKRQTGFTAIEVMISMTVMSILLGVGITLILLATQLSTQTRVLQDVNNAMFAKVQEYENKDFSDIPNGLSVNAYEVEDFSAEVVASNPKDISSAVAKVYSEPLSGSLKKLTYSVTYSFGTKESFLDYVTFVQVDGVGR